MYELLGRKWWVVLVRGILGVLLGLMFLGWPLASIFAMLILFAVMALVDGLAGVIWAFPSANGNKFSWQSLFAGLLGIAAGVIAATWPGITALWIIVLIGVWSMARGLVGIYASIRYRHSVNHAWILAAGGVISIAFGLMVATWPVGGALAMAMLIGMFAIIDGALTIYLGMRLRHHYHEHTGDHAHPAMP